MHRGYIKDWRKSLDNPLFKKPFIWHFWGYCLKKTSHKDRDIFMNGQMISIKKGQFVFGRKIASEETGLSEQQIRTCLKHLEKSKNLTIKSTNRYTIINIINWDTYQQDDEEINQQINQQNKSTSKTRKINQQSTSKQPTEVIENIENISQFEKPILKKSKNQPAKPEKSTTDKNVLQEIQEIQIKKKIKKKSFSPPTPEEVQSYFFENGFTKTAGLKAFNYYDVANWKDSRGNQVKNWKQKMISVWFKDENKINGTQVFNNRNLTRSERNALECQKFINGRLENAE